MLLATPEQMREMDRQTIEDVGIPGIVLMERAALGAVDALVQHFRFERAARIGVICGGGNNGGDGFAMARILHDRGFAVWVGALRDPSSYAGDAAVNLEICERIGVVVVDLSAASSDELLVELESLEPCDAWVDAIFGTGLDREIDGAFRTAIEFLNTHPRVFSVDIPSGVHGATGNVMGCAVKASATATFGLPKLGQALYPGRQLCGALYPVDIGIPTSVVQRVGWEAEWLDAERFLPRRAPTMHKGTAGRVLILGGQPGMAGSVLMAARAALTSGAGLVAVGTYDDNVGIVPTAVPEAMSAAVLSRSLEQSHVDRLEELLEWADVVAIGPGLGTHDAAFEVLTIVMRSGLPVVVDADGLTLLAERRLELQGAQPSLLILTPHPGELARLDGCEPADVSRAPIEHARRVADEWSAIVVAKGAATAIVDPHQGRLAVNASGNPGMATAGMGDALTGMLAAALCESVPAFEAIGTAVWVHGAAGDRAADRTGHRGLTVSHVIDSLGEVWLSLEDRQ